MFWSKFPYTNFHELNADWIMAEVKRLKERIEEVAATITDIPDYVHNAITEELVNYQQKFTAGVGLMFNTAGDELRSRVATASVLGSVRVGDNLNIDSNGKLDAVIPTAGANTLGGVKVGAGLSINSSGILTTTGDAGSLSLDNGQHTFSVSDWYNVGNYYTATYTFTDINFTGIAIFDTVIEDTTNNITVRSPNITLGIDGKPQIILNASYIDDDGSLAVVVVSSEAINATIEFYYANLA